MPNETSLEHSNKRAGVTIYSGTYIYGTSIVSLKDEPYQKVLLVKVYLTKLVMKTLVLDENMDDNKRIQAVNKAEIFNRELLKEIGYSDKDISTQLTILDDTKDIHKLFIGTPTNPSLFENLLTTCKDIKLTSHFGDLFQGLK